MNNFTGDLLVKYLDGEQWEVAETFTYHLEHPEGDEYVHIGRGFITDFASIPRTVQLVWRSPGGKWDKPAVVHDCLYKTGYVTHVNDSTRTIDRDEADRLFYEAMAVTGVNWFARRMIYAGVRVGGWLPWGKYRGQDAA